MSSLDGCRNVISEVSRNYDRSISAIIINNYGIIATTERSTNIRLIELIGNVCPLTVRPSEPSQTASPISDAEYAYETFPVEIFRVWALLPNAAMPARANNAIFSFHCDF